MAVKKTKSQKILSWTTKDIVLNVVTYVLNLILISLIFVGTIFLNGVTGGVPLETYFEKPTAFLHFFILLMLMIKKRTSI
jgi:hypothetical protein